MSKIVTMKNMSVKAEARIDSVTKKHLMDIINNEFSRRLTDNNISKREKIEKIVSDYCKSIDFKSFKVRLNKVDKKRDKIDGNREVVRDKHDILIIGLKEALEKAKDKKSDDINAFDSQYEDIYTQKEKITCEIFALGLSIAGKREKLYSSKNGMTNEQFKQNNVNCDLIDRKTEKLNQLSVEINNLKNKIVARLLISQTIGEAAVIMREVLGNEILPTIKVSDMKLIEQK